MSVEVEKVSRENQAGKKLICWRNRNQNPLGHKAYSCVVLEYGAYSMGAVGMCLGGREDPCWPLEAVQECMLQVVLILSY
jgi:hypothetical protein